jgi:large subunit ribosomal protein L18
MLKVLSKNATRQRVHRRIRRRMAGRAEVPRLNVYRSLGHIYAQVVDDSRGQTLVSASSVDKEVRKTLKSGGNVAAAKSVGKIVAERAKQAGVSRVVFDRGGYAYHGRVKALADAAREAGLQF